MVAMDTEIVYLESVNATPDMTANIAVKVSFEILLANEVKLIWKFQISRKLPVFLKIENLDPF